jgi:uncharacterized protein YjbJ (UPF0337 family)
MSNRAQDLKGRAERAAGAVVDDEHLERRGRADQAEAAVKNAGESVKEAGRSLKNAVER